MVAVCPLYKDNRGQHPNVLPYLHCTRTSHYFARGFPLFLNLSQLKAQSMQVQALRKLIGDWIWQLNCYQNRRNRWGCLLRLWDFEHSLDKVQLEDQMQLPEWVVWNRLLLLACSIPHLLKETSKSMLTSNTMSL